MTILDTGDDVRRRHRQFHLTVKHSIYRIELQYDKKGVGKRVSDGFFSNFAKILASGKGELLIWCGKKAIGFVDLD